MQFTEGYYPGIAAIESWQPRISSRHVSSVPLPANPSATHPPQVAQLALAMGPFLCRWRISQRIISGGTFTPLQGWDLPEEPGTLRRLVEARMGRPGKREFVQVLRLLKTFSQQEVHAAVKDALRLGAVSFDAVKRLVLCRLDGRPPRLDLELYPYLPRREWAPPAPGTT